MDNAAMKERNLKRKQAMKKARELILRKKALHKDISAILVDIEICSTCSIVSALETALKQGVKGYHKMRGRELVKHFENVYAQLHDPLYIWCFYQKRTSWSDPDDRIESKEKDKLATRQQFMLDSDALMSRLMEMAFDLDIEE